MFTACSSDIEYTNPDNTTDEIAFSVGNIGIGSRADDHTHKAWDATVHANTLGVFGFCDDGTNIFSNQKVSYTENKWDYNPKKYWKDYADKTSFDFFGYMVESADLPSASLTHSGNSYTLSFPASISAPILTSADKTPLICHTPVHRPLQRFAIPFEMDQTLTGYRLQFQLGEKMDALRYFVIKSVKVSGVALPKAGTVSRTYTFADGAWTAGDVEWSVTNTEDFALSLAAKETKVDTHTEWVPSDGGAFYAIPHASFTPTIEVTYDVYSDASTRTRKDVTSTIVLNSTNFKDLTTGTTGEIHPVRIKIVPDYLYVLSDDDQATGFLVVGN